MNQDNSSMDMDLELAKKLFHHGAVLVIAGVPVGTEFGIDLCTYKIGDRFRGIKMIPEGAHYVYCSAQSPYGDSGARVGFLYFFKPFEIVIREWDNENEELRERKISDPDLEKRRIRENLKDLDRFLGAYDYRHLTEWRKLTDSITEEGVKRCIPECGVIRTNVPLMSCSDAERPRGNTPRKTAGGSTSEDDLLPDLKPIPGTGPRFTEIPDKVPLNSSPTEISQHHIDNVVAIDNIMEKFSKPLDLIEEIQIAFALYLVGHSIEGLTHWRKLLHLLSNSEIAAGKYKLFFMKYLDILQYQLPHIPEEFMEPSDKNTIYKDVRKLLVNCTLSGLSVNSEKLMDSLKKSIKWKFNCLFDEDPDEMPVIVETE